MLPTFHPQQYLQIKLHLHESRGVKDNSYKSEAGALTYSHGGGYTVRSVDVFWTD